MGEADQFKMLSIGIMLGQNDSQLDMSKFKNLEELRVFLNNKYNINIECGMVWHDVLKEIESGIAVKCFNDAMGIV